jgi:outer membrane protein assembly factor BamB
MALPAGQLGPVAIISAPLLWPVAAILQLLFPVVLREQARAYRWACAAVVSASGLISLAWLLDRWWPAEAADWLPPYRLAWAVTAVTAACAAGAWWRPATPAGRPARLEWAAFAVLALLFGGRAVIAIWRGQFEFDLGAALGAAAVLALLHLAGRRLNGSPSRLTTQRLFLTALVIVDAAVAYHHPQPPAAAEPTGAWPMFRGEGQRTGSINPADSGPARPHVRWRFQCRGDARVYASPALAGGELLVVANQSDPTGGRMFNRLYRLDAGTGALVHSLDLPRAGISSPVVRGSLVLLGEGYHQDRDCRLLVVDRRAGAVVGAVATASHVESSPALDGDRAYFGAGDDGVYGVEVGPDGRPQLLWHAGGDHVDAALLVVGGTVFAGSVPGEATRPPSLFALDAATGTEKWRVPTPLAALSAPAFDAGRVFVALGNGTLDRDADRPAGAVWCLDPATGHRHWEVSLPASVYAGPACRDGRVYVARGDGVCLGLRQSDGGTVWETPAGGRVVAGPIVSGGAMFVLTEQGVLTKLDAATGRVVWRFDDLEELAPDPDVQASPVLAGGRIYLAVGGKVVCVGDRGDQRP